ncbi:MAG TPA: STAS domain-containing protein [Terracidiphilus sp.]|nr:STAS domain-containing protein [Terracidiphilus sp.]
MQITQHPGAELLELRLTGRIDATWAEHLSTTIEQAVRAGAHRIALNCSGVDYISSLGIRVLVVQAKMLKSVKGSLLVTHPTEFVRATLQTVGLASMISDNIEPPARNVATGVIRQTRGSTAYEIYPQPESQPLACRLIGDPAKLAGAGFTSGDSQPVPFPVGTFGLGLGAFGSGFADCESRFGEFLAAGGCALTLPTNEHDAVPDFVIEEGGLIPRVEMLYGIAASGDFSTMVRFDGLPGGPDKTALSELVASLLDLASAPSAGFVILAETVGMVGATLRRSPAHGPVPQTVPAMRDWLSFTTERVSEKSLALLVGVAAREPDADCAPFFRPLRYDSRIRAHIHAAVFPYRPVQRGELPFAGTVAGLLAASNPRALLHLMADSRPFEGVGETDLSRGACWLGPISTFAHA